jgi:hypothetical protein
VGSKILETEVPKLKPKLKPSNTKKQETQKTENQQEQLIS